MAKAAIQNPAFYDEDAAREADVEEVVHRLHDERKDRQQEKDGDGAHQPRAGKRPCGRKYSTTAISR